MRILVVDDSVAIGRLVTAHLERDGHAVTAVTSAMAALAATEAGSKFDLYLLDVHMQRGDPHGISLARMLEQRDPKAVIIFMTGDANLAAQPELAGRKVLAKPIDFAALRDTVATIAARR